MGDKSRDIEIEALDPNEPRPQDIIPEFPESLKEFEEIPQNLVPVYTAVPYHRLEVISHEGLRVKKNKAKHRTNEDIFTEVKPGKFRADRTNSIYAIPFPPEESTFIIPNVIRQDYLVAMVDPKAAVVADIAIYNEAQALRDEDYYGNVEQVRKKAREYWDKAVTLEEFLKEDSQRLRESFEDPEVLIPNDIPPSLLKMFAPQN